MRTQHLFIVFLLSLLLVKLSPVFGQAHNEQPINPEVESFGRRFVSLNAIDLALGNITGSFEFFNKSGYDSFRFPVTVGIQNDGKSDLYRKNLAYSIGAELNTYKDSYLPASYFIGPGLELGAYRKASKTTTAVKSTDFEPLTISYTNIYLNNGFLFSFKKGFTFSMCFALGIRIDDKGDYYNYNLGYSKNTFLFANFTLNLGYRF